MPSLGIDVGGTTVKAGLISPDHQVLKRASVTTPRGEASALLEAIAEVSERLLSGTAPDSAGVTVPGTVTDEGVVKKLTNLGLYDIPLKAMLEERLGFPFTVINDADAAALAEMKAGALRGVKNGLMLTIGTGLGGAIIFDGRLFKGGLGRGTELGHMLISRGIGRLCGCGLRGCAETLCSATALAELAQRACNERRGMIYSQHAAGEKADAKLLLDCAAMGDEYALVLLDEYTDALSDAAASFVNILDPEVIAIGGGVSAAGELLLAPLRRKTAEKCFFGSCGSIVRAEAGNDAGMIGAVISE